jgi:hypothetical protein
MKKIFFFVAGLLVSAVSFSQLSFGIHGTGNLANARVKYSEDLDYKKQMRAMPAAGVDVQYAFSRHFAIRSGANYVQNGVRVSTTLDETVNMTVRIDNNLKYVQVPVTFLYTVPVARVQLYAGAGGFVNYGISGKSKMKLSYTMPDGNEAVMEEESDPFKKEEDGGAGMKRTDYGVAAMAGVRLLNGLFLNVGYQHSLSNIEKSDDEGEYKNRGLQLTLGFFFR